MSSKFCLSPVPLKKYIGNWIHDANFNENANSIHSLSVSNAFTWREENHKERAQGCPLYEVALMYVQLQHNYRDNYCMGKINNFIS